MHIPQFYKECIDSFQEMCRKGRVSDEDEIIWHNHKYIFNERVLNYSHWAKCGIHKVSHLYKDGKMDIEGIQNKLKNKSGFIFEIQTIKSVFPDIMTGLIHAETNEASNTKGQILNDRFKVPGGGIKNSRI